MRLEAAKAGSRNWVLWLSLLATFALVRITLIDLPMPKTW